MSRIDPLPAGAGRAVRNGHGDADLASLLSGENGAYVETLFEDYLSGKAAVPENWRRLFDDLTGTSSPQSAELASAAAATKATPGRGVFGLVDAYRTHGHLVARLDPLGRGERTNPLLDPREFGFDESAAKEVIPFPSYRGLERGTPEELVASLERTYCGSFAVQFMEMGDKERRDWLIERMEPSENRPALAPEERRRVLHQILAAEGFEQFLHRRFVGQKRFSIEGGESLIPLLDTIIEDGAEQGAKEMVLAMAHRGRLNVLVHTMAMPYEAILQDFRTGLLPADVQGSGDVKYHRGYSTDRETRGRQKIHLSLCANPSHLEAINPVAEGIVRGKQNRRGDGDRVEVVPILIHGDAAFNGQGVVAETLVMSELEAYWTGGTIHIIVNNQIGFTTDPAKYCFTRHPGDMAKAIQAPMFHVNADDPEACVHAARLAIAFRQRFREDVIIDLVCYRRHGHNEGDDPTFTQPTVYKMIEVHKRVGELHSERLLEAGVVDAEGLEAFGKQHKQALEAGVESSELVVPLEGAEGYHGLWSEFSLDQEEREQPTAVPREDLAAIGRAFTAFPEEFHPHPKARRLMELRTKSVLEERSVDWATAEALAIGSLLAQGKTVRFTGQDVERGTFSQRHAALFDTEHGDRWLPLQGVAAESARFMLSNSPLSEAAVLGFEYGYSTVDPARLVIWEAQYGDFANGAQVIIDQFIASAEQKWMRSSGLVMLLPHGYEGHGPEHSSARLERFLQLCAEDNLQVANLTTPAQIFHALRRQLCRPFRKPLIVMSPKSLLRHKRCVSPLDELETGSFCEVLDDPGRTRRKGDFRRVLICSGKVAYTLEQAREEGAFDDVAIVRLEEIHPFPFAEMAAVLRRYATHDFAWVQEEPWNMGAWSFVQERLRRVLPEHSRLRYVGRSEAASPATGSFRKHEAEEAEFVAEAFARARRPRREPAQG